MTTTVTAVPMRRSTLGLWWIPLAIVIFYALVAVFGPLLLSYDPVDTPLADRLLPPGSATTSGSIAVFGTDSLGRDVFAQVVYGARTSMLIGLSTVAICCAIGVALGVLAGYFGKILDAVLGRFTDVLLAFPGIVLAIVVAGLFERSIGLVILALSLTGWISFARLARGSAMSFRSRDWVDAARVMGVSSGSIMLRHILPFVVGPVAALFTVEFGLIVLAEAGLSFLGIGLPASAVSWGQVIASGKEYLATAWWISAFPGIALAVLVLVVGLLGDQLSSRYQRGSTTR
jgi:ABC-type dipeptide/oligopeptide/nickel transport system permease subunit